MQVRHRHPELNPREQAYTTARHVLPFIEAVVPIAPTWAVLEIGCGEGGNLAPFLDRGCRCVGIDVAADKLAIAARFFDTHPHRDRLSLVAADIHDVRPDGERFDLVVVRDAIEHIAEQERFLGSLHHLLQPHGRVFVGFPPWRNPFGGHQHHLTSRVLSQMPYWHLLPRGVCHALLRAFGEPDPQCDAFLAVHATGLSIAAFEQYARRQRFVTERRDLFLVNPNFEIKFGLRPRRQLSLLAALPAIRDLVTTTAYYLLRAAS